MKDICRMGIDIGSTTLKIIILNNENEVIYKIYRRHKANMNKVLTEELNTIAQQFPDNQFTVSITGSAGMGIADRIGIPFTQEVVAAIEVIKKEHPYTRTMIDLGGEDAKMVFFEPSKQPNIRMNGNCAGGTGAFIDQMADLMHISIEDLGKQALQYEKIYPVASRCGVFAKTDVQNLIARNTQISLQEETDICRSVDPWAGSYYVESLTNEIAHRAWDLIQEVEKLGGMAAAIESGIPKMRIEEASARKQARIDSGQDTILGVNKYRLDKEAPIETLEVDNTAVRESQLKRLAKLRAERNEAEVQSSLEALSNVAATGKGNLLEYAIDCARKRASLGEISDALEKHYGRYKAKINLISGVYSSETKNSDSFKKAQQLCDEFAKMEGRRPRIMIAKMGQDGHDRGAKVVATGYADLGFDVDMGPLFQTPAESAKQAVENDVHIVGVSSLAAGHKTLVPQVIEELKKLGREDIMVIVGGVIPAADYDYLYKAGAAAIFGPGSIIPECAIKMLNILIQARK
jgi:methylmalonyl-CoA mutase